MKVDFSGSWIGLGHVNGSHRSVSHFSKPDRWKFGFDLWFILVFDKIDEAKLNGFRDAFTSGFDVTAGFDLSDSHYMTMQSPSYDGSLKWRVLWDNGFLDLALLNRFEELLNAVAEAFEIRLALVEAIVIPRSLKHISALIATNVRPSVEGIKFENLPPARQEDAKSTIVKVCKTKTFGYAITDYMVEQMGFEMTPALEEVIAEAARTSPTGILQAGKHLWEESVSANISSDTVLVGLDKVETPDPKGISAGEVKQYANALRPIQLTNNKNAKGEYVIHDGKHRIAAWRSAGYMVAPCVFVKAITEG